MPREAPVIRAAPFELLTLFSWCSSPFVRFSPHGFVSRAGVDVRSEIASDDGTQKAAQLRRSLPIGDVDLNDHHVWLVVAVEPLDVASAGDDHLPATLFGVASGPPKRR